MAQSKKTITIIDDGVSLYIVKSLQNSIAYRIGQQISEKEIKRLIKLGNWTIKIVK